MRVFVTGANGFIGTALVRELLDSGHQVLGLTRREEGVQALTAAGAEPLLGTVEDLDCLRTGAAACDAVIHLAFNHDFSKFVENCETDRRAIEAMGEALAGTDKLLIVTSGTGMSQPADGGLATEDGPITTHHPRIASELAVQAIAKKGVRAAIVRLPQVHDTHKQGLVTFTISIALQKGVVAYVGNGSNRWPAAALLDVAHLYRLALEKGEPAIYNAVAEEGITTREIAETVAAGMKIPAVSLTPEQAKEHFGWMGMFAGVDLPASSAKTRKALGWNPTGPGMIEDLKNMNYADFQPYA